MMYSGWHSARERDLFLSVSQAQHPGLSLPQLLWGKLLVLLLAVFLTTTSTQAGSILREVWLNIGGTSIGELTSDPRFPDQPSLTSEVTDFFEAPTNWAENYGTRMHGYIVPPVTGNYVFWIATDDGGELWLSTDESPARQRRIAWVNGWTNSREWTREPNQRSASIYLEAGQNYYVAALQKEASGGDNLAVRWRRPDGVDEGPIPADHLRPWGTVFGPPEILTHPDSATVVEGKPALFTVTGSQAGAMTIRWERNETEIPGPHAATLIWPATLADQGARFRAILSNSLGIATSEEAVLTVLPDTTRPGLISARNLSATTVRIVFTEPVELSSATDPAHYSLSGGATVLAAAMTEDPAEVLLTTSTLTFGTAYTIAVNAVRDRADARNEILPGSSVPFTAYEYAPEDVGGSSGGEVAVVPGGYDVTGSGRDIGGSADQFQFSYQERTGDFDLRVRVAQLSITDPFVQAGLMVRETLEPSARFAGVFASSAQLGCFFKSRSAAGGTTQTASPAGGFPVNYPHTWLRLRRSGSQFTGFGSFNGTDWQELGSVNISLPARLFFGMAVASQNQEARSTAQFRELGPVMNPRTFAYKPDREPLGPSNRRTGVIFSEIMYHPAARADGKDLEFIEIYNAESIFADLSGWRLAGAVNYTFPAGFQLRAGEFAVVALDPKALEEAYGLNGVLGPYTGRLNNAGELLQMLNPAGAIRLEVEYAPTPPWPVAASGAGHSLVLARPSYGEQDPRAWAASDRIGGSPGQMEAVTPNPWASIVINEFLAHTDEPLFDFIELHNSSTAPVDLSGCFLTDDPSTNRFRIPDGTVLSARGFVSFDQNQLGFALSAAGETIYLIAADESRVIDAIRFAGQENGISTGRSPDGSPTIRPLAHPTPGAANALWWVPEVVLNELMYNPISRDDAEQYVELYNNTATALDLSGWRLADGISYEFPSGAAIPAHGYVVVAKNTDRLRASHPHLTGVNTFGNFSGNLSKSGERVALTKPDTLLSTNSSGALRTNTIHIVVNEVTYVDGGRWPKLADGGGSSLELIDPRADTLRASNWAASDETQKAPWTTVEWTGVSAHGGAQTANRLFLLMLGAGECMVDDIAITRTGSTNLLANGDFENGQTGWNFYGHHRRSRIVSSDAFSGNSALRLSAPGDGDTANNTVRGNLSASIGSGQTVTVRAKVRWLSGWPEMLFRVRGNWIEVPVRMDVPTNLGTPGLANSRKIANAGPAIYDVAHSPALPRANEPVLVTCRVADPDGVSLVQIRYRVDPASTLSTVLMRDDGTAGDAVAGDGIYTATLPGRPAGNLAAFRIEAADAAQPPASSLFPADAPARECLIRWNDPIPWGTFAHYHIWSTSATEQARNATPALDNTYSDATLVYGNFRIIYNAGFRDKGSPYHGGGGDWAVTVPADELLLGSEDRVFASTGNGGSEETGMRGDVSAWIGAELGIPFLHSHYMRLYRNGSSFRDVLYDLEQPNRPYARSWYGGESIHDDLYKIAIWFEFADNNSSFQPTGASLQRFLTGGEYRLARYRWNWQLRTGGNTANDYTSLYTLITTANSASDRIEGLQSLADMEQWMRVFVYNRILGNWDSFGFNLGQNMFLYAPMGGRATLLPWDIDFVLGLGNGTSDPLWGGHDSTLNQLINLPVYKRMIWRAYQDAITGPLLARNYGPQIDARRTVLQKNGLNLGDPRTIRTYIEGRRTFIARELLRADTQPFAITTNGGEEIHSATPSVRLNGTAPIAVASLEINGRPYPVTWTTVTGWQMDVPLAAATNVFRITARNRHGQRIPDFEKEITVRFSGAVPRAADWVMIHELMFQPPPATNAEFIELYNRHPEVSFDLSGFRLAGLGYTFPVGSIIRPGGYLVLAENRAAFATAYGAAIPVADEYTGKLDNEGEWIRLLEPGDPEEILVNDVRYSPNLPWPSGAAGTGKSLQLIDPSQDNWRPANWAVADSGAAAATPGRANSTARALEPFPRLWINEVLPVNQSGATDNQGTRAPWIELYNAGETSVDLGGHFLSDDFANLRKWPFPIGSVIAPGQFLLVWADGQSQSTATELHASFRLAPGSGAIALSRLQFGSPAVLDSLPYEVPLPDHSYGGVVDGEPRQRRLLHIPTPGAPNNPSTPVPPVFINEWMASNSRTLADPADGSFDDWFELYNAGTASIDLSGFFLSVNLTNKTQFRIPNGTLLPAAGFRLFWADNATEQNGEGRDVHTNFRLTAAGSQLGLFTPEGILVDGISFGPQTPDVSQGRSFDGAEPPFVFFETPTPGAANGPGTNERPRIVVSPAGPAGLNLEWTTQPGTRYRVQSTPSLMQPAWTTVFDGVASATTLSHAVPVPHSEPHRFYRVVVE